MYYIYSRKSKCTGKGESIENQVEICKDYIFSNVKNARDTDIFVYEDEGFSAKNLDRPMFKKMIDDSTKQKVDYIICYRLDRISRNVSDFSSLITDLNDRGISFVSVREQFDTSRPMGRAMMYMASVFAQLERETIAERIRDNMLLLAHTGRWLGGIAPTGYKSEKTEKLLIDGKKKQMFRLKIIPQEADTVRLIFGKFKETNSLTKVETYLLQKNIKSKNKRTYTRFSIKSILENPVYMIADENAYDYFKNKGVEFSGENLSKEKFNGKFGIMAYNKTLQREGKHHLKRDIKDWIISIGDHKGLIPSLEWVKIQDRLLQNSLKSYRKTRSNTALLSGVLFCGKCGDYMRPKLSKRKNINGEYIYTYLCQLKEKSRLDKCQVKNIPGNELDEIVCNEIKKIKPNNIEFSKQLLKLKKEVRTKNLDYENEISRLLKSIDILNKEISSLVIALGDAQNTPAQKYITQKINDLDHEKNRKLDEANTLKELSKTYFLSETEFNEAKNLISSFGSAFNVMSKEQKRVSLRSFIHKIAWDGETVHVYLYGSDFCKNSDCAELMKPICEDSK